MTHQRGLPDILTSSIISHIGIICETPGLPAFLTVIHRLTIRRRAIASIIMMVAVDVEPYIVMWIWLILIIIDATKYMEVFV